jgi:hypothetical protein
VNLIQNLNKFKQLKWVVHVENLKTVRTVTLIPARNLANRITTYNIHLNALFPRAIPSIQKISTSIQTEIPKSVPTKEKEVPHQE